MAPERIDTRYLESLVGYNVRRASLSIIELFLKRLSPLGLRPVEFSVLSLVRHNPGITSRQVCATLGLLPPNLVGMVARLEQRDLIRRERHPVDGRALSLRLSAAGETLMAQAEIEASRLELDATAGLAPAERDLLIRLLQRIYRSG